MKKKQYAVCVNNKGYKASLETWKIYEIVPDKDAVTLSMIRVIDESGDDYLYPAERFMAIRMPEQARQLFETQSTRNKTAGNQITL